MSDYKTIPVKPETKEQIDEEKPEGMSYDLWIRQNGLETDPYEEKDNE